MLSHLLPQAEASYHSISFDPEKRGQRVISYYSHCLEEDLKTLGASEGFDLEAYKTKFIDKVKDIIARQGRVMSWAIVGPANFPVTRNQKNMRYLHNAEQDFEAWRERLTKRVFQKPQETPEEAQDRYLLELDQCVQHQEAMKEVNKILRLKKMTLEEKMEKIKEDFGKGYEEQIASQTPFERFQLALNNAKIKRLHDNIIVMKERIKVKNELEGGPINFKGGSIVVEDNRVQILFDSKPCEEYIKLLKKKAFKWSPTRSAWVRKYTLTALDEAKGIVGLPYKYGMWEKAKEFGYGPVTN